LGNGVENPLNHRDRFFTAIELETPDYVPITDLGLDPPIVAGVLRREKSGPSISPSLRITKEHPWETEIENRLAMIEACRTLDFDAVPAITDYISVTKNYTPKLINGNKFIDQWGRVMQVSPEAKTTYFVGGTVNAPEDLVEYEPPHAFDPDVLELIDKLIRPTKKLDVAVMGQCHSGWHLAFQVRGGVDKISVDFYRNPDFAKALFDKIARACYMFAEAFIEAGIDVLVVGDDYADNHGPMISPRLFEEYELPHLKNIVNLAKKHGVPVLKHSDGNLYPILDDIVAAGIDALHPIEPGAMDLKDVKQKLGDRICIVGNVDCRYVLPYGNEHEVRKDVRRCIDAAAGGGGFVLASSNSIHGNVNVENVYVMVNEARTYGKYPLSSESRS